MLFNVWSASKTFNQNNVIFHFCERSGYSSTTSASVISPLLYIAFLHLYNYIPNSEVFLPSFSLYKFPGNFVEGKSNLPSFLKGCFAGGFGTLMLVDYSTSNAGPYGELLLIPGKFRHKGKKLIIEPADNP